MEQESGEPMDEDNGKMVEYISTTQMDEDALYFSAT